MISSLSADAYTHEHVEAMRTILPQLSALVVKGRLYELVVRSQFESERLLRNVLPEAIVKRLKAGEETIADGFPEATVVFVDLVNFVTLSATMSPAGVVIVLNRSFSAFDALGEKYGVEKIKTSGDTVNMASRMEANGAPGRIHVTRGGYDKLKDDFEFEARSMTPLKGIGEMETYFLNAPKPGREYRAMSSTPFAGAEGDGETVLPEQQRRYHRN